MHVSQGACIYVLSFLCIWNSTKFNLKKNYIYKNSFERGTAQDFFFFFFYHLTVDVPFKSKSGHESWCAQAKAIPAVFMHSLNNTI